MFRAAIAARPARKEGVQFVLAHSAAPDHFEWWRKQDEVEEAGGCGGGGRMWRRWEVVEEVGG